MIKHSGDLAQHLVAGVSWRCTLPWSASRAAARAATTYTFAASREFARNASLRWGRDYIAPEHMLLGILDVDDGVALDVLRQLFDPRDVRATVERRMRPGRSPNKGGPLPFTKPAKSVLELALDTASCFGHDYIGTEHLLLGLLRLPATVAARALDDVGVTLQEAYEQVLWLLDEQPLAGELPPALGLDPEQVRGETERRLTPGETPFSMSQLPFTPAAVRVLELTLEAAREFGDEAIGPPHLLVGLLREGESVAAQVLRDLGVTLEDAVRIARDD